METFKIRGEYIQLNQLLKMMGWSSSGAESNALIDSGIIKVNGKTELRKRNKLVQGDVVEFEDKHVKIE